MRENKKNSVFGGGEYRFQNERKKNLSKIIKKNKRQKITIN